MRFADDMVVRGNSQDSCRDFVYRAAERLHWLGLNINVAKVRYVSKLKFNQYWGFEVMDRFEYGDLFKALTSLKNFIANDDFGRKSTALKRAIALVSKANNAEAKWWKDWVPRNGISTAPS